MKIQRLFLKAFGPFTDTTLDFTGAANLHVVFGANEAGKSSALRAMADLRYGIHARSQDDFVHAFKAMLVAGTFEDVAGGSIGLARRKGNKDTLMAADPATGEPIVGAPVSPDVALALTGGVAREQFETMYGLDSERLRRGGRMLIQGEGDLGATLFEASTGSADIKAMLATLKEDARGYFAPRGQTMQLNDAARQIDEARQRYRQAVIRPEQWKALKHVHDVAAAKLQEIRAGLAAQRRRQGALTELRAVEPLLRQLERAAQDWERVHAWVPLATDARELRLAALQRQTRAEEVLAEVEATVRQCRGELAALTIEPQLMTHAAAIERLAADMAAARRERATRIRLEASTDAEAGQLALQARRMVEGVRVVDSLDALYAHAPSAAGQAQIDALLDALQRLTQEQQHARKQLGTARTRLAQLQSDQPAAPPPDARGALALALTQGQALGDIQRQLSESALAQAAEQHRLDQAVRDLGLVSWRELDTSGWIAPADIDVHERERAGIERQIAFDTDRMQQLQADLALQERRRMALAATGEVVTADSLQQAREARDGYWARIRTVFIDPFRQRAGAGPAHPAPAPARAPADAQQPAPEPPDTGLGAAFERAQSETDRQADLLREGAQRAAEVAECGQRIQEMTEAIATLRADKVQQAQRLTAVDAGWTATLHALGLPHRPAASLRAWLVLRESARELAARLTAGRAASDALRQRMSDASEALVCALGAVGSVPPEGSRTLAGLVAFAAAADRAFDAATTAAQRRAQDMGVLEREIAELGNVQEDIAKALTQCQEALDGHCGALFLALGAAPEAIKARLAEFRLWTQAYALHAEHLNQVRAAKAAEAAVAGDARALAALLGESQGDHLEGWVDDVVQRLQASRDATMTKANVERRRSDASGRGQRAQDELDQATEALASLVRQAGVADVLALPDAEVRSDQRRQARARLDDLAAQLASTSTRDAATLRAELADQDSVAIDAERQGCDAAIEGLEAQEIAAIATEQAARAALEMVDTSDQAAQAREAMEAAIARYRSGVRPWAQLRLAEALLAEALRRHREKAQGPVVVLAGEYLRLITGGRFVRLVVDDDGAEPVLMAQPAQGKAIAIAALSEGTGDQLHLALRLAALEVQRRPERRMPLVLDDVFITSDDARAANIFKALEKFATQSQVLVFTHHRHLVDIATQVVAPEDLKVHRLGGLGD